MIQTMDGIDFALQLFTNGRCQNTLMLGSIPRPMDGHTGRFVHTHPIVVVLENRNAGSSAMLRRRRRSIVVAVVTAAWCTLSVWFVFSFRIGCCCFCWACSLLCFTGFRWCFCGTYGGTLSRMQRTAAGVFMFNATACKQIAKIE